MISDLYLIKTNQRYSDDVLNIIKSFTMNNKYFSVRMDILSESHRLIIETDDFNIHEIYSCSPIDIPNSIDFGDTEIKIINYDKAKLLFRKLSSSDSLAELSHNFNQRGYGRSEYTKLVLKKGLESLVLYSLHEYPEENKSVFTKSIYKI